jgi:hypothetical protein
MPRTWSFFLILFLVLPFFRLAAQEEETPEEPEASPIESEWVDYNTMMYTRGDKTFAITLGVIFPVYFTGDGIDDNQHNLKLGGTGSLSFNYFFSSHFFVGGELSGMFSGTRAGNMLYIVPFGVRLGFQFVIRRFEFPLTLMIGAAPQKYLEKGYFGFILKPGASVFWRFNPDWSFGLNGIWWFVPEWPKNGQNAYGNFVELTLSARYHF